MWRNATFTLHLAGTIVTDSTACTRHRRALLSLFRLYGHLRLFVLTIQYTTVQVKKKVTWMSWQVTTTVVWFLVTNWSLISHDIHVVFCRKNNSWIHNERHNTCECRTTFECHECHDTCECRTTHEYIMNVTNVTTLVNVTNIHQQCMLAQAHPPMIIILLVHFCNYFIGGLIQ